jgi:hypothetical protein
MVRKIKVEIVRFVDDSNPGFVECHLVDAWQRTWVFVEKVPVVTIEYLDSTSIYPSLGVIAGRVVETRFINGQQVIRVDTNTPWGINSTDGETLFDVFPHQLTED